MFIVVAIVIFGIFVSLSYTLFGKTLQPQVVQLFEQGIERATDSLAYGTIIPARNITIFNKTESMLVLENTKDSVEFSSDGSYLHGDGIRINTNDLQPNKKYKISYDISHIKGNITKLGGHVAISTNTKVKLNGLDVGLNNSYFAGIPYTFKDSETLHVDVEFDTSKIYKDKQGNNQIDKSKTDSDDMLVYIQPNRGVIKTEPITVKISNIKFVQM